MFGPIQVPPGEVHAHSMRVVLPCNKDCPLGTVEVGPLDVSRNIVAPIHSPARKVENEASAAKACEDGCLAAAVEVRSMHVFVTEIAPVHLAAAKIQSRPDRHVLPGDQRRFAAAVKVGPLDGASKKIAPVNELGAHLPHRSKV